METPLTLNPALSTHLIHQFPLPTWIENLAVRSNGQLLVTLLTTPDLYLIDPSTSPATATLVHTFSDYLAVTGIIELKPDIFFIATGNFNAAAYKNEQGSYSVWEVDMTAFDKHGKAGVKKVVDIKESGLLNGMELLSEKDKTILIADSEVGCVWKVDVGTGKYEMVIQVEEMKIPAPPGLPMGINGVKIRDGYLYWTNTGRTQLCRIKINGEGKETGNVEVMKNDCLGDDFVFDGKGNAWITQNVLNTVAVVKVGGDMMVVAGKKDELEVAGGTACQFGRKAGEEHILYVTTTGALAEPINGSVMEGGKVIAINTKTFQS